MYTSTRTVEPRLNDLRHSDFFFSIVNLEMSIPFVVFHYIEVLLHYTTACQVEDLHVRIVEKLFLRG